MKENFKKIDIARLHVGDVFVSTDAAAVACAIRARTWGWPKTFDLSCGTHAGVICDRGDGLLYACEMKGDGLSMTELFRYDWEKTSWWNHFTVVLRHPTSESGDNAFDLREKMNDFMIKMHSTGVKYGYDELLSFLAPEITDDPYRMICSEWARCVWKHVGIMMPWHDDKLVSPMDWQVSEFATIINPFKG